MRRLLAIVLLALALRAQAAPLDDFDLKGFGSLPVVHEGRRKPLDTLARSSLLLLRGKQTVRHEDRTISAIEWFLDVVARPSLADLYPTFRIDDQEVLDSLGLGSRKGRYFSFHDIGPGLAELERQGSRGESIEVTKRTRFERAAANLYQRVIVYYRLRNTFAIAGEKTLAEELQELAKAAEPVVKKNTKRSGSKAADPHADHAHPDSAAARWDFLVQTGIFLPLPPADQNSPDMWKTIGAGLKDAAEGQAAHPALAGYAQMFDAWHARDPFAFSRAMGGYESWLRQHQPKVTSKAVYECYFNAAAPFYWGMVLYVIATLLVFYAWLMGSKQSLTWAWRVALAAFVLHTTGLLFRMVIEGRPPVTNLYSSAIFVGWVAVALGLILERRFSGGLGSVACGVVGFSTLIIAHHLNLQGDTMEMMRAVLDSNFWLATHVVTITIGYGACFLAAFFAHIFILRGRFTRSLDRHTMLTLTRMTYGVLCFALLFSVVGTVLGGIWADQSWGRFWGWDPKENGALLIVLWIAIILHARWGGFIRERGLMILAIFGGVVTSLSWFGVNMLGIGLHSYGFMDKAFFSLMAFIAAETVVAVIGMSALADWKSAKAFQVK
ncbi:MAG: cytochrome c biogenesis protein CcsA [Elusimicrobiota bacterium]